MFCNPIIGGVGALINNDKLYQWIQRRADSAVAYQLGFNLVACGDPFYLVLNRTGISIDIDFNHLSPILAAS